MHDSIMGTPPCLCNCRSARVPPLGRGVNLRPSISRATAARQRSRWLNSLALLKMCWRTADLGSAGDNTPASHPSLGEEQPTGQGPCIHTSHFSNPCGSPMGIVGFSRTHADLRPDRQVAIERTHSPVDRAANGSGESRLHQHTRTHVNKEFALRSK